MPIQRARKEADWPQFDAAVRAEVDSLWRNGTWVLADLPRGAKLLPTQMLCERKRGADGEVSRHKGRFVACGNHQVAGRDYTEVWAPVARHATLRALLSTAAAEGMMLYQLDVETAFLNGEVDEELYLQQPRGYERGGAGKVCRLFKAIYGLKQAARAWYLKLVELMTEMGMEQCTSNPCLFSRPGVDESTEFVLVYVDDILLMCKTQAGIDAMKQSVMMAFSSRDIGPPSYFLGLHIGRDEEKGLLTVSHRRYVLSLVERHGLNNAHPVVLPLGLGATLGKEGVSLDDEGTTRYQELLGGLLYVATCTRPDISFAVGKLARHAASPTQAHLSAAKGVLKYLKGTADLGLRYGGGGALKGYCDADFAGDVNTRRSTTGYAFLLHGAAIAWMSKVQPTVAISTTEAEYIAAAAAAREALWLRTLVGELGGGIRPVPLLCDNQGAIKLMHNPAGTARSKHIDIAHHFVRDRVDAGQLTVTYIPTADMVADVMTKALPSVMLVACWDGLGVVSVPGTTPRPGGSVGDLGEGLTGAGSARRVTWAEDVSGLPGAGSGEGGSWAAPREHREAGDVNGAAGPAADGMVMPVARGSAASGDPVAAGEEAIPVAEGAGSSGDPRAADTEALPAGGGLTAAGDPAGVRGSTA